MGTAADTVRVHAQPLADAAGLDLVDVEVKGTGPRTLVRVKVDRKGGVELAECQQLSRDLSRLLDEADPIDSRYQLEVSSPGVNHPLRTQRDFDRVEGRLVAIRRGGGDQADAVKGTVRVAAPDHVVLDVDGAELAVAYDEIETATQALPW
jgi:ribosome maturation factor RimP